MAKCGIFFVLLLLLGVPSSVRSIGQRTVGFRPVCKAKGDIVLLQRDSVTGEVVRVDDDRSRRLDDDDADRSRSLDDDDDRSRRLDDNRPELVASGLRGGELFDDRDWFEGINLADQPRSLQEGNESFYMRECSCPYQGRFEEPVYCPLNVGFCGVYMGSSYGDSPLGCLTKTRSSEFVNNAFLVLLVWFFILASCLVFTVPGRHFFSCLIASCIPGWNRFHANRMMRRDPEQAQYLMRRNLHLRRQVLEHRLRSIAPELVATATANEHLVRSIAPELAIMTNDNLIADMHRQEKVPTSLSLKTRIYKLKEPVEKVEPGLENIEDEEDLDTNCIICFQALEDGDRVGDLACDHTFHADCLKSWLKRRNVCPLCASPDIATPRFDEIQTEEHATSTAGEGPSGAQAELPPNNVTEE
jgi:hypothetical protein